MARPPTHTPGNWILWSDTDLLVVNKPAGLRVIPDGYDPSLPTLVGKLEPDFGRLFVVHRLDKDTSGVILFARTADAHRILNRQFAERLVKKTYIALVAGVPGWNEYEIKFHLKVNGDRSHRTVLDSKAGKPAHTTVQVSQRFENYSAILAHPHTGYTHQIRAHLSALGHPLLGDSLYQYPPHWTGLRLELKLLPQLARTALHAQQILLTHPTSGEELSFSTPPPEDMQNLLQPS